MAAQIQHRHIGDTRIAIAATLVRPNGTAVDLSGLTVKFQMLDTQGTAVVAETADNVSTTDASAGEVQYDPQAADVDTAGSFAAYFTVYDGTDFETFPVKRGDSIIEIHDDT